MTVEWFVALGFGVMWLRERLRRRRLRRTHQPRALFLAANDEDAPRRPWSKPVWGVRDVPIPERPKWRRD